MASSSNYLVYFAALDTPFEMSDEAIDRFG